MVSDVETGKPRGFAFVEFEDPQAALSAIRNMNDYEINGRRLRLPEAILYCMSELDMIKTPVLGTAPPGLGIAPPLLLPTSVPPPSSASIVNKPVDPRAAARPPPAAVLPPPAPLPSDPRARDPRAAAVGGGAGVHPPNFPAPPPMMAPHPGGGMPPPMTMPPPMAVGMQQGGAPSSQQQQQQLPGQLDPSLVQQVMALTPAQIAQLPPDKQQNILLLRQQITGGIMR
ncbi:hypothetical protein ACHAW5_011205 [Stephanodiscus triporus]|uniref:RRM domain-containing protein n=1 Tax=Stephanodiscus triporus TaxID=2934178 RepID=A0ABD3PAN2_9STRA